MRELSVDEQFSQMITREQNRDNFMWVNTSTFPDFDEDGNIVYRIRYGGSMNLPNAWSL